jgi:hypothetical protein
VVVEVVLTTIQAVLAAQVVAVMVLVVLELLAHPVLLILVEVVGVEQIHKTAATAVQVSLSSRFLTPGLQPSQAALCSHYQPRYQDLRFTP